VSDAGGELAFAGEDSMVDVEAGATSRGMALLIATVERATRRRMDVKDFILLQCRS